MMKRTLIQINFTKSSGDNFSLEWHLIPNFGTALWLKLFKDNLNSDREFIPRFSGFVGSDKTMDKLGELINHSIEIINADPINYSIEDRYRGVFDQEFSNCIHHHFEVLIGQIGNLSHYYQAAEYETKQAICQLNSCIHDMETLERNSRNPIEYRHHGIIGYFDWDKGIEIPSLCDSEFTLDYEWGDMVLNYSQIGKTWLEVYLDKDEDIFEEAIIPHRIISGSFDIFFGKVHEKVEYQQGIEKILKNFGHDPKDPKHRVGYLPIAHLNSKLSKEEIVSNLTDVSEIRSLSLWEVGKKTYFRSFR